MQAKRKSRPGQRREQSVARRVRQAGGTGPDALARGKVNVAVSDLLAAVDQVVANWESGDLAGAVNRLRLSADDLRAALGKTQHHLAIRSCP